MSAMFTFPAAHPQPFDRCMADNACFSGSLAILAPPEFALSDGSIDRAGALPAFGAVDDMCDTLVAPSDLHRRYTRVSPYVGCNT